MIAIPSPVEGILIERDLRDGCWSLSADGRVFRLRPWSWGERRRILECATVHRALDPRIIAAGIFDLLMDPPPEPAASDQVGFACLCLLGVASEEFPADLVGAELAALTTLGWQLLVLDAQPAAEMDRLLHRIQAAEAQAGPREAEDGWTRIVFPDAADAAARAKPSQPASLYDKLARAAGAPAGAIVRPGAPGFSAAIRTAEVSGTGAPPSRVAPGLPAHEPQAARRADGPRADVARAEAAMAGGQPPGRTGEPRWDSGLPVTQRADPAVPRHETNQRYAVGRTEDASHAEGRAAVRADDASQSGMSQSDDVTAGAADGERERQPAADRTRSHLASAASAVRPGPPVASESPRGGASRPPQNALSGVARLRRGAAGTPPRVRPPSRPGEPANDGLRPRPSAPWPPARNAAPTAPEPAGGIDFPGTTATVEWPDWHQDRQRDPWPPDLEEEAWAKRAPENAAAVPSPFALSELEERLADVLDRAAREAGVDLP